MRTVPSALPTKMLSEPETTQVVLPVYNGSKGHCPQRTRGAYLGEERALVIR